MNILVITIAAVLAVWVAIGLFGAYIGYRCGRRAAILEMGLVERWQDFHHDRRSGFAEVSKEVSGENAPIVMRGAIITPDEYMDESRNESLPPRIPAYGY